MTAGTLAGLGDATVGCSLRRMPTTGHLERGVGRSAKTASSGMDGSDPGVTRALLQSNTSQTERERERDGRGEGGVSDGGEEERTAVSCVHVQLRILIKLRSIGVFPTGMDVPEFPEGAATINTDDKGRLTEADEGKSATSLTPGDKISCKRVVRDLVDYKPEGSQRNRSFSIFKKARH